MNYFYMRPEFLNSSISKTSARARPMQSKGGHIEPGRQLTLWPFPVSDANGNCPSSPSDVSENLYSRQNSSSRVHLQSHMSTWFQPNGSHQADCSQSHSDPSPSLPNQYRMARSPSECRSITPLSRSLSSSSDISQDYQNYDCYLAVAEEDVQSFGQPFAEMAYQRMNMHLFLSARDLLPGRNKFEEMAEIVKSRCNGKVIFVVSKGFPASDECQFLVSFSKTLDPYGKNQTLIPLVIDKNVRLPSVLEGLTCINYNSAMRENWLFPRLWQAIHGDPHPSPPVVQVNRSVLRFSCSSEEMSD